MVYRLFIEDVGKQRFSGFSRKDFEASSLLAAIFKATGVGKSSPIGTNWRNETLIPRYDGMRLIALPFTRKDLWPNPTSGKVPLKALNFGRSIES